MKFASSLLALVRPSLLAIAAAAAATVARPANAQGISYTIAPAATSVQWDSDFGLRNHSLYGGQASIDFERLISLQGFYFTNDKINTAVDRLGLSGELAEQLTNQRLRMRSMGANVIWKLGNGGVAPFIKTGGGILELRPDSGRTSKHIQVTGGAGIRFGSNAPVFLDIFAEDMVIRADRYAILNPGAMSLPADPDARKLRHNMVVGAAVGIPLGLNTNDRERNAAQSLQWGLSGASLTLEPFAGRLRFDQKQPAGAEGAEGGAPKLRDQDLVGLRAGIDIGRYVGVRGFYWRGVDKDFKRTESLQSWGGEMQFRLNSSPGLTPYLLAGAAQLDFKQDDSTNTAQRSDDKVALILGAGVSVPFGERFALNVAARDYLYGQGNGADSVASPSDLRSNWMYTVGLRVSLAGRSGAAAAERSVERQRSLGAQLRADSIRWAKEVEIARLEGRAEALGQQSSIRDSLTIVDGRIVRLDSIMIAKLKTDSTKRSAPATNMIMLPVPTVGELYVRYGTPQAGATTQPNVPTVRIDSLTQGGTTQRVDTMASGMSEAQREAMINRRIDSLVALRVNERTASLAPVTTPPPIVVAPPTVVQPGVAQPVAPAVNEQPLPRYSWMGSDSRGGLLVYSGFTASSDPQILIGGRFDLGPLGNNPNSKIHFAPEIAFGAGSGGRSTMLVANAMYMFGKQRLNAARTIQPHVLAGIGVLNFSDRVGTRDGLEGIINLGYGVSIPLMKNRGMSRATPVLTIEHLGVDFFNLNRIQAGLSWRL
ncbi:MAG: outer membrane protein [Gemmatimonas sp.]